MWSLCNETIFPPRLCWVDFFPKVRLPCLFEFIMQFILHCRSHQVTCFHSVCSPVNFLKFSRLHTSLDKQPRTTNRRGCCSAHVFLGDVVQLQITSINYRSLHVKVTGNEKQNMCLVIGFKLVLFFDLWTFRWCSIIYIT